MAIETSEKYVNTYEQVHAVVVTYHPDLNTFPLELNALAEQVDLIWVLDNGADDGLAEWLNSMNWRRPVRYVTMKGNQGIGAAQNKGILLAKTAGAVYVLLMDQDSLPARDMVGVMLEQVKNKTNVAAVGPSYQDARRVDQQTAPFSTKNIRPESGNPTMVAAKVKSHLIASGCLIPIQAISEVGYMREDLFIDYVDTEWCLRANAKGLVCYQIPKAQMQHNLGDEPIRFLWRTVASHSALRHYYQYRNAILLYKDAQIPLSWKIKDAWRMTQKFLFFLLFAKPRTRHMKMMCRGVWHGIKDIRGQCDVVA